MHDNFMMSVIEMLIELYDINIILIIPEEKFHRIGGNYFDQKNIEYYLYKVPRLSKLNKGYSYFLTRLVFILKLMHFLYFDNYKKLFIETSHLKQSKISLLALEAYPFGGNRRVRYIIENFSFNYKSLVLHDSRGYGNTIRILRSLNTFKSKVISHLLSFSYIDEINYFDGLVVLGEPLVNEVKKYNKNIHIFPSYFPCKNALIERDKFIKNLPLTNMIFVVPGSVDSKRRNYKYIIDSFINRSHSQYELVFLGKVLDYNIIHYAQRHNVNVKFFDMYVDRIAFELELIRASFVIYSPSPDSNYGETLISGIPSDAFRYGVPLLNLSEETHNNQIEIKSESLPITLDLLLKPESFSDYYKKYGEPAIIQSKNFNILKYKSSIDMVIGLKK